MTFLDPKYMPLSLERAIQCTFAKPRRPRFYEAQLERFPVAATREVVSGHDAYNC